MITPNAARFVLQMLHSCGNKQCETALARLALMRVSTPLTTFTDPETGHWLKPVFGSLQAFAKSEGLYELDLPELVRYFGGAHHIEGMIRKAPASSLTRFVSLDEALVLDVLLPLRDGHYRNGSWDLDMGEYVVVNPDSPGQPYYHRGLVVNLEVPPTVTLAILEDQRDSGDFAAAMGRIKGPISLPAEYLEALRLNCTK